MLRTHSYLRDRTFLCAAEAGEADLGPGGVPTPTPEPGPTPTPQPEPSPTPEPLKPVADLLGKKAELKAGEVEPKPEPKKDGAADRINALTREKWEEKRAREAAEARAKLAEDTIAELQKLGVTKPAEGEPKPEPAKPRVFTQTEVEAEARRIAAQANFNQRVDEAVIAGRKEHADYDEAITGLKSVTGPTVPGDFLAAALETGSASELIYHLGKNPSEADRILSMPGVAQAVALTKLAAELSAQQVAVEGAEPKVSKAPPPIKPRVGGATRAEPDLETMPMADFIAKRNADEAAKRATRH